MIALADPIIEGRAEEARWSIPKRELSRFRAPGGPLRVSLESDEVTTLDPRSNRPDFLTVRIEYVPGEWLVGSRGLRQYFQWWRDQHTSIEGLARAIADDVVERIAPRELEVVVHEKPRGGIAITATVHHVDPPQAVLLARLGREIADGRRVLRDPELLRPDAEALACRDVDRGLGHRWLLRDSGARSIRAPIATIHRSAFATMQGRRSAAAA